MIPTSEQYYTQASQEYPATEGTPSLYEQYRKRAEDCFRLNNGRPIDFRLVAELYKRGHEAGDLNCTYGLADCYMWGVGVPRQFEKALELAQYLLDRQCPLGSDILGELYNKGWGVPLDRNRGRNYLQTAKQACAAPLPGIDENVRFGALRDIAENLGLAEEELYWCRQYAKDPRAVFPCGMEAASMADLPGQLNEEQKERLRTLLREGCGQNDPLAMMLMGVYMLDDEDAVLFPPDPERGKQLILQASTILPHAPLLLRRLMITGEDEDAARMWDSAQLGVSLIPAPDDLKCLIRIHANIFSVAYRVYSREVADDMKVEDLVNTALPPRITIQNNGDTAIPFFDLRVCICEQDYDQTFRIEQAIPPGEEVDVPFDEHQIPVGDRMMVEVSYDGRKSMIDYEDFSFMTVPQFLDAECSPPPLLLAWDKGLFGGYQLLILNVGEQPVSGITILKQNDVRSNTPITIEPQGHACVKWSDFPDSKGLSADEVFYLLSENYSPAIGVMLDKNGKRAGLFERLFWIVFLVIVVKKFIWDNL